MPVNYSNRLDILSAFYDTQKALAKRLGVSEAYVSRLLNGKRDPDRMSRALKRKVNRSYRYISKNYSGFWVVDIELESPIGDRQSRTIGSQGFDIRGLDRRLGELYDKYLGEKYAGMTVVEISNPRLVLRRFDPNV